MDKDDRTVAERAQTLEDVAERLMRKKIKSGKDATTRMAEAMESTCAKAIYELSWASNDVVAIARGAIAESVRDMVDRDGISWTLAIVRYRKNALENLLVRSLPSSTSHLSNAVHFATHRAQQEFVRDSLGIENEARRIAVEGV